MFLKRLSAALVTITCLGWAALGAAPGALTTATNNGKEKSVLAPLADIDIISDTVCFGAATGVFDVTYSGAKTVSSYQIFSFGGSPIGASHTVTSNQFKTTAQPLPAGKYRIDLTFTVGPNEQAINEIFQATSPLVLNAVPQNPLCSNGLGTITLTGAGGFPPYSYTLTLQSTGAVIPQSAYGVYSNLASGQYHAVVKDKNGCEESYNFGSLVITIPPAITAPIIAIDSIDFPGDKAVINLSGLPSISSSYKILLDEVSVGVVNGTSAVINNVSAGSHRLKIQSSCPTDVWPNATGQAINIADYLPITYTWDVGDPNAVSINCFGQDTTLKVTVGGGRAGKTIELILLEGGIARPLASALPFGVPYPISDLKAGVNYTLLAYNTDDSELKRVSFTFSGPAIPFEIANVTPTNVTCNGLNNGKALVALIGGSTPYFYTINSGASFPSLPSNKTITGLEGNSSYNIVLKDSKGCLSDTFQVSIEEPDPISVSVLTNLTEQLTCPNSNTAKIYARAYGGTKPYYYTLKKGGSVVSPYLNYLGGDTVAFSNLASGNYEVSVKDGVCPATASDVEVIDPLTVSLNIEFDAIKCNNGTTNIYVSASGGIGSLFNFDIIDTKKNTTISLTETSSGGGVTFPNIPASSYRIQANYGTCTTPTYKDTLIENPRLLTVNYPDTVKLKCPGDLANIVITASGSYPFQISTDGINYSGFEPTIGSHTITGLTAGSYTYYIKDKFDCVYNNGSPITITVIEPAPIIATPAIIEDAKCNSKNNGSVTLTVSGGSPGYTIWLVDAVTSAIGNPYQTTTGVNYKIQNVPAGTYNLKINDRNGCVGTNLQTGIEVKEPEPLVINAPQYDEIRCFGSTTIVTFSASGGWPVEKTIKVVGEGVSSPVPATGIKSLAAGFYTITATNVQGCTSSQYELHISQPEKLILDSVKPDNVSCFGANDAKISFSVTGGVPGYQYGLGGLGSAGTPFTGLSYTITTGLVANSAGYKLVIKDAKDCYSNVVTVPISEPALITFSVRFDSVSCNGASDGKIIIENATGGENKFNTFLIRPGGTEQQSYFPLISNLPFGDYLVRIADNKNCTSETKQVSIGQPEQIVITNAAITDSLSCFNGQDATITISAIGGLPYNLQYKVTNGTIVRGYQPGNIFTNLPSGEWEVWVKNSKGKCEIKYPTILHIINPDDIVLSPPDVTSVSCYNMQDGEVQINAVGGTGTLKYSLIDAPARITNPSYTGRFTLLGELNSTSTIYYYRVEDQNSCKKSNSFTVLNPPALHISELNHHDVLCSNQSNGWIEVEVTGGTKEYSFQRTTGTAVTSDVERITDNNYKITKYNGGTFTPVVIDANGCTETVTPSITIVDPQPIQIVDPIEWGEKKCNGDMDDVTTIHVTGGTPGFYYSLDNGATFGDLNDSVFIGLEGGVKYPRVKDINDCMSPVHQSYIVEEPLAFGVAYKFFPILCYDDEHGDMELKITGGTGSYTFSINDPAFASNTFTFANAVTDTTTILLSQEGTYLFPDITYNFFMHDENGCHLQNIPGVRDISNSFADTSFTRPLQLVLDSLAPHRVFCGDSATGRIEFFAHGGTAPQKYSDYSLKVIPEERTDLSYINKPGINSVEKLRAGLYYCILTDKNGCFAEPKTDKDNYTDTTTIDAANKAIVLTVSGLDTITCNNSLDGAIEITAKNFLEDGIFWEAQIWQNDTVRSTRPYSTTDNGYIEADPRSSEGYKGHMLYSAYAKKIMEDIGIGRYIITVTDSQTKCTASIDTILFSLNGDSCPPLSYYNAFTHYSGGNKYNDWSLGGSKNLIYNLKIYTSWGDLVYDSYDKNGVQKVTAADRNGIKWDGLDNKQRPVPAGTYIYLLHTGIAPRDTLINGNITILRNNGR
jgi:hypothetical protein